jgi:hypothetical protein
MHPFSNVKDFETAFKLNHHFSQVGKTLLNMSRGSRVKIIFFGREIEEPEINFEAYHCLDFFSELTSLLQPKHNGRSFPKVSLDPVSYFDPSVVTLNYESVDN